ncbi:hypothetical protein ZIOFF_064764 [Zingiber officinale]|uniref:Peptidase A1 domain-containing protein n=1 Tax=Zingiber officinale TaxID=94328 RepID=A0A8J5EXK0_ZINOF|nr:hypothetical protein ZIOFF_064764 [Zingiber officinale]
MRAPIRTGWRLDSPAEVEAGEGAAEEWGQPGSRQVAGQGPARRPVTSGVIRRRGGGFLRLGRRQSFCRRMTELYYTSVKLGNPSMGNPSRVLYVQINTGSDILWVTCNGWPTSNGLKVKPLLFSKFSTPQSVRWINPFAPMIGALQPFKMGKCSVLLLVLQTPLAVTLSSMMMGVAFLGVTPRVFSHCLKGSDNGRSILVLGEIIEPGIVYTPLVPSHIKHTRNHHRLSTTLAYLAEQAYDHFGNAIIAPFSPSVHLIPRKGNECFITTGR